MNYRAIKILTLLLLVASAHSYVYTSSRDNFESQLLEVPENNTGFKDSQWHEGLDVSLQKLVERDILIPEYITTNAVTSGVKYPFTSWIGGIIPYYIDPVFNEPEKSLIQQVIAEYHKHTCIKFKPRVNETDYIQITSNPGGCSSYIGRIGGRQIVNLQIPGCIQKGIIIHELMHAVGFAHEQNRPDRDQYVRILWENVQTDLKYSLTTSEQIDTFGLKYDYDSIMHYSSTAFSINGKPTILPLDSAISPERLGQLNGFSKIDIAKIKRMYTCTRKG